MAHAINNYDIGERVQEIEHLIMNDDIGDAGLRLLDFARDFDHSNEYRKEIIIMNSMIKNIENAERKRTLKREELKEEKTKILYQMLEVTERIEKRGDIA